MSVLRAAQNPLITPAMVPPSRPGFDVVGVFNPGVTRLGDEVLLLLRVAEAPQRGLESEVAAPFIDPDTGQLEVRRWTVGAPGVDTRDPRVVVDNGRTWLTSISHFTVARSRDGIQFEVEDRPAMLPDGPLESFGIEDPRITRLDDSCFINYSAVSPHGIATRLASTRDFVSFERLGVIFAPPNRDVTIFPERIGGRYAALHRPMPEGIGEHAIWSATSPDLMAWGDHRPVASARPGCWDDAKVGGGAPPFRVRAGGADAWLAIYHGVSRDSTRYALGALLLDADDPSRVIGRSRMPILSPEAPYERDGFFGGVVFTCGVLVDEDVVRVYYGAADGVIALATLSLAGILDGLA